MSIEFVEGERDSIEDLDAAKKAITKKMITEIGKTFDPIQLHYTVIIRALDELIMIRKIILDKRKEENP